MQRIRYLDKLVDELAKGKAMEKVLRSDRSRCETRNWSATARQPERTS